MKKIVLGIILMLILFFGNILVYLAHTQFKCTDKIKNNQDLNIYEIFSALQCHACFWMFGWVVDPNTAQLCFLKQFYLNDNYKFFNFDIPEDERLKKFKEEAKRTGRPVRMSWPKYTSRDLCKTFSSSHKFTYNHIKSKNKAYLRSKRAYIPPI